MVFATLALLMTAFLFAPTVAYLLNAQEVAAPLGSVLAAAWPVVLGLAILTAALSRLGPSVRSWVTVICLLLSAVCYVQSNLFAWDYGTFDGSDIDWGRFRGRGLLEVAVIVALAAGCVRWRRRIVDHARILSVILVVLQALATGSLLAQGGSLRPQAATTGATDIFDFSPEQNVLVIVLDAFQLSAFESVLADRPELNESFDGFTLYRDALGVYPTTMFSIPAMLSSRIYDNSVPIQEFLGTSLAASLPVVLAEHGLATSTVTKPSYCPYLTEVHCAGQRDWQEDPDLVRRRDVLQIWDLALFRCSPHFLRSEVYEDHAWLLQRNFAPEETAVEGDGEADGGGELMSLEHYHRASWNLWNQLLEEGRTASPTATYKFIHVYTSHSPWVLDEDCQPLTKERYDDTSMAVRYLDQCACTVSRLVATLERLDALGIYDRTMIVVTADHGSKARLLAATPAWRNLPDVNRVFPLLLIKPFAARGTLRTSDAQASLVDLPRTICNALDVPSAYGGFDILDEIPEPRRRLYYDYRWKTGYWQADFLPRLQEFEINGPARDATSWRRLRNIRRPAARTVGAD